MVALTEETAGAALARARWPAQLVPSTVLLTLLVDVGAGVAGAGAVSASLGVAFPLAVFFVPPLWLLSLAIFHGYEQPLMHPWSEEMRRIVRAGLAIGVAVVGFAAWQSLDPEPAPLLALFGVTVGVSIVPRATSRIWRSRAAERDRSRHHRIVVAGSGPSVQRVVAELRRTPGHGLNIVTSEVADLAEAVRRHRAAAVIAVPCAEFGPSQLRRLGWDLERTGTQLFLAPGLIDVLRARAAVACPGSMSLVHVRASELSGYRRWIKDGWERGSALLALLLLAPVLALVVLAIRIDSPGPAVFRQVRLGRHGRPFTMFKLRTMHTGAEGMQGGLRALNVSDQVLFKVPEDPRVTRIGRFLRRYSIDELPQLFNVVLGQMALVGPRPPLPTEALRYAADVERRFAVKPGVTGLWQVSGRSDLSWEESVRLDLRYVDNWSLALDLQIVARTARAVLRHDGAY